MYNESPSAFVIQFLDLYLFDDFHTKIESISNPEIPDPECT